MLPVTTSTAPLEPTTTSSDTTSTTSGAGTLSSITIAAVGDWYEDDPDGDGYTEDALLVRDAIIESSPDVVLGLGDFSYGDVSTEELFEFLRPLEQIAPIYPTFGNHDGINDGEVRSPNRYTRLVDHFGLGEYFVVDVGAVRFISINSEFAEPSPQHSMQFEMVSEALESASQDSSIEMVIPFFHNAMANPLSPNGPDRILQEIYYPLLAEHIAKIPLALQANHHIYTRTHLIAQLPDRDGSNCRLEGTTELCQADYEVIDEGTGTDPVNYQAGRGMIFVTVGTGGAHPTGLTPDTEYMAIRHKPESSFKRADDGTFGFLLLRVSIDDSTIIGEFRANNGEVLDHFSVSVP